MESKHTVDHNDIEQMRHEREEARAVRTELAKLREALEFYAEPSNYKGAFVQGGYTDHGTFAMSHHINLVRRDAGAIARAALRGSAE